MAEVYCIDASALVDLKYDYPRTSFAAVWTRLGALVPDGRLIAPREVYRELSKKEDEVYAWAGANGAMFSDPPMNSSRPSSARSSRSTRGGSTSRQSAP